MLTFHLQTPDKHFDTGELLNRIKVTSLETWKYEQQLSPDLKLDLFKSFSRSTNGIQQRYIILEKLLHTHQC